MTDEVLCRVEGKVGRITLNRPQALHALTTAMCKAMIEALLGWRENGAVEAVLIDHSGERGFCAGGDIRMLAESGAGDGAQAQLETLKTKSPQTMKVAFRQLHEGARLTDFGDNMRMEYRIGARVVQRPDFLEGVRAVIVDKDNAPKWNPATLSGVTEAMLDAIFAPLAADQEWSALA